MSQQSQQTQSQYAIKAIDKRYDLNAPFAPGSYIELEVVMSDDSQAGNNSQVDDNSQTGNDSQAGNVKWSFIEIKSQTELQNFLNKNTNTSLTTHILLDSNQQPNKQYRIFIAYYKR